MATNTKIILKKSSVAAKVPATGDLEYGEVALNYADGKLYYKDSSNNISAFLDESHGGGSSANTFGTFAVSGQSNVVADSTTDTLTLVAGSGMAITTDAGTDTITFTSTGGYDDSDVDVHLNTGTAANNQVLSWSGTDYDWVDQSAGGGGITYTRKTTTYTATSGEGIIADTSGGVWTLTLPATPSAGDIVIVVDGDDWANNNLTVGRNGSTIEGDAEDMTMDIGGAKVSFIYDGTTWQIYAEVGVGGDAVTLTGVETLTNKTLTDPAINLGADSTGDLYYRAADGSFERLAIGANTEVLTVSSGIPSWEAAAGGGSLSLCKAYGTSTASVENASADLTWSSPSISTSDISVSGSDITINTTGVYMFSVTATANASHRLELTVMAYIDSGSGYSAMISDFAANYAVRDTNQNIGSTTLNTAFSLTAGHKIKFNADGDGDGGSAALQAAGTLLIITRVS